MTIWKPFRILFIKSTDFTHDYQQAGASKINKFYKLWAHCYDFTVGLDPAYKRELRNMVNSVVKQGDITLDIGCGTGLGTIYAAAIAKDAIGIDPSRDMTEKLQQKIQKRNIENIEIRNGYFPDVLTSLEKFDSVTSSFMLAHLVPESRAHLIANIFDCLNPGGRLGLFSAQGEIAPTFQIRGEILGNLSAAGFQDIQIRDVSDIYRIATATKH
jgi:cyclopropane fatty-acyl-phospholipid synthase-like methyltransferase